MRVVGAVVLAAVVVVVLFTLLNWYVAPTKPSGRKDLVLTLAQILGGTALLLGLYFTWRGQQNAQAQLEINRRGQITERFTQAIDQLGSKDLEIQLGGIYSLERTAYEDRDHHWPVMEVLTAYVRQHAPLGLKKESSEDVPPADPDVPKPDIQAILTVLGRRSEHHSNRKVEYGPIDLHATHLMVADLHDANLSGADLSFANLWKANLSGANLSEADLSRANLAIADLSRANLSGADLSRANLSRANLSRANLWEANLSGTDLSGADLGGQSMYAATNLRQAQLEQAIGDQHTQLASNLNPPARWAVKTDDQSEGD